MVRSQRKRGKRSWYCPFGSIDVERGNYSCDSDHSNISKVDYVPLIDKKSEKR